MTTIALFDADCGVCAAFATALSGAWFRADTVALPLQEVCLDDFGIEQAEALARLHVVDADRTYRGGAAIARILMTARVPWPLMGWLLQLPGIRHLTERCYTLVARNRHRLPGGSATCDPRTRRIP